MDLRKDIVKSTVCTKKKDLSGIPVLLVEVVHVRHEVLDHVHVGEGVDLGLLVVGLDLAARDFKL